MNGAKFARCRFPGERGGGKQARHSSISQVEVEELALRSVDTCFVMVRKLIELSERERIYLYLHIATRKVCRKIGGKQGGV